MKIHVMTLCTGYSYPIFQRFVGSLYDTGFSGSCYIFCQDSDLPVLTKLKEEYPNIIAVTCDLSRFTTHMQSSRFKYMAEYLEKDLDYDYLFICDSRDVLFQRNIEEYPLKGDLYAFEEEQFIGKCRFNSQWIHDVERVIQRQILLQDKPIICSGTIIVSKKATVKYLNAMSQIMLDPRWVKYPADQGPHNFLCYENPLKLDIVFSSNIDNLVNTVGYGHKEVIDDKIVNSKKEVSYAVHQYDRMSQEDRKSISVRYNFM